jgi:RHS repeat-associated protein
VKTSGVVRWALCGLLAGTLAVPQGAAAAAPSVVTQAPAVAAPRADRPAGAATPQQLADAYPTQAQLAYADIAPGPGPKKPKETLPSLRKLPGYDARVAADAGTGSLSYVETTADLNCRAQAASVTYHPDLFFGGTACGTFLTVGGRHFGPSNVPAGSTSRSEAWSAGAQTVTGNGSAGSPWRTVSRATAGDSGLSVAQIDTWVQGASNWSTTITVRNSGTVAQATKVYRAADCYVDGSDSGGGYGRGDEGSATCVGNSLAFEIRDQSSYTQPTASGSLARVRTYVNDYYSVWSAVGSGAELPNTWLGNQVVDNGHALGWSLAVNPGQSLSVRLVSSLRTPSIPLAQLPGAGAPGVSSPFGVSTSSTAGDPVNTANGAFYLDRVDATLPGPGRALALARSYSSDLTRAGVLGRGWVTPWDSSIAKSATGDSVTLTTATGAQYVYTRNGTDWQAPPGGRSRLLDTASGYQVIDRDGTRWNFNTAGRIYSITNARGQGVTMPTRNSSGWPTTLRDSMGRQASIAWSGPRITSITMPGDLTYTFEYTNGFLTKVTAPSGRSETYGVDSAGRITSVVEGTTTRITNRYDSTGRVVGQSVFGAGSYTFAYAALPGSAVGSGDVTTTVTNPEGVRTAYEYRGFVLQRKVESTDRVTAYRWDADLNLIETTDAEGRITRYEYNRAGDQTRVDSPDGTSATMAYDDAHNVVYGTVSGTAGWFETSAEYNAAGELIRSVDEAGGTTAWVRDGYGRPTTKTDPSGRKLTFTYDSGSGQLVKVVDALGRTSTIEYDSVHVLPVKSTSPGGSITSHVYDADGNEIQRIDPVGAKTTYTYDAGGRQTSATDALGRKSTISYRADGVVRKITGPDGVAWNMVADSDGRVTKRWATQGTTDLGRVSTATYAGQGQLSAVSAEGGSTAFERSLTGDLLAATDGTTGPGLGRTGYSLNQMGRVEGVTFSDGTAPITMTRDSAGLVSSASHGATQLDYTRDALGAVTSQTTTIADAGATVTSSRNAVGDLTARTYADGSTASYTYDAAGQVIAVSVGGSVVGRYGYTFNGNVYKATYKNGLVQDRKYDKADRLLSTVTMRGTTVVSSDTIVRDILGRPTRITQVREGQPNADFYLRYTAAGFVDRICSTSTCSVVLESFTYDPLGNITKRVRGGKTEAYSYVAGTDKVAEQTVTVGSSTKTAAWGHDARGRVTTADTAAYTWDATDRLVSRKVGSQELSWTYDAFGRPATFNGATSYVWDAEESGPSRLLTQQTGSVSTNYVYGPLGAEFVTTGGGASVSTLTSDLLGSVTAVTDGAGQALRTWRYDTFGVRTQWSAAGTSAPAISLGYAGSLQHGNLVTMGQRVLDSSTGRFLSVDPASDVSGQAYSYAANSPYEYADANGGLPTVLVGAVVGAVGGAIWSGASYGLKVASGQEKFSGRALTASVVGGAVGGGLTGACVGTGAGALASAGCGALGGAAAEGITGVINGTEWSELGGNIAQGAALGAVTGGLGAKIPSYFLKGSTKQIQNQIRFTNRMNGGINKSNILPWSTTGNIGRWIHEQTIVGGALGFVAGGLWPTSSSS